MHRYIYKFKFKATDKFSVSQSRPPYLDSWVMSRLPAKHRQGASTSTTTTPTTVPPSPPASLGPLMAAGPARPPLPLSGLYLIWSDVRHVAGGVGGWGVGVTVTSVKPVVTWTIAAGRSLLCLCNDEIDISGHLRC